jgi:protein involved in polysaccharide export with SLBB domain
LNKRSRIFSGVRAVVAAAMVLAVAFAPIAAEDTKLVQTAAVAPHPTTVDDERYVLGSGDKIKVTVYGEDDLSGEFIIDGSGHIQLPLIGQLKAAGLNTHQFVDEVRTALQNGYLNDPKINVQVLNYRPFYIIGEVNKPGEYPFESGLTILRAVALAGGYTYRANDDKVYVRRVNEPQESRMPADSTTRIYPGDIVRVPERIF